MLDNVLKLLEAFGRRTGKYVKPVQISTVQSFLQGLEAGCSFGGLQITREVYQAAAASRGWKWRATGIVWHMRVKKLNEEAIIQELIAVEIEAFRQAAAKHE